MAMCPLTFDLMNLLMILKHFLHEYPLKFRSVTLWIFVLWDNIIVLYIFEDILVISVFWWNILLQKNDIFFCENMFFKDCFLILVYSLPRYIVSSIYKRLIARMISNEEISRYILRYMGGFGGRGSEERERKVREKGRVRIGHWTKQIEKGEVMVHKVECIWLTLIVVTRQREKHIQRQRSWHSTQGGEGGVPNSA